MTDIKQVIVVRKDLGMRKGKMIAQGAHASMMFLTRKLGMTVEPVREVRDTKFYEVGALVSEPQKLWLEGLFTKVCVSVDSEEELLAIHQAAQGARLVSHLVTDAGLTEFGGVHTNTAVAIGPDYSEKIDQITGHLKLL